MGYRMFDEFLNDSLAGKVMPDKKPEKGFWDSLKEGASKAWDTTSDAIGKAWDYSGDKLSDLGGYIADKDRKLLDYAKTDKGYGTMSQLTGALGSLADQGADQANAYTSVMGYGKGVQKRKPMLTVFDRMYRDRVLKDNKAKEDKYNKQISDWIKTLA